MELSYQIHKGSVRMQHLSHLPSTPSCAHIQVFYHKKYLILWSKLVKLARVPATSS